ncbi:MAG: hypothetical protein ACK4GO_10105 [Gemmobacter sp.]
MIDKAQMQADAAAAPSARDPFDDVTAQPEGGSLQEGGMMDMQSHETPAAVARAPAQKLSLTPQAGARDGKKGWCFPGFRAILAG